MQSRWELLFHRNSAFSLESVRFNIWLAFSYQLQTTVMRIFIYSHYYVVIILCGRVDNEWKRAEGVYITKEKDSRSLTQFRPISLLNVEGKVFFTIKAHPLHDVQPIHWHHNPERRSAGVYWAHHHDLGINSASKEEPLKLVRRVGWPREHTWVSATSTPLENIGEPPCTNTRDQDPTRIFQRVWDEVLHDGLYNKVDSAISPCLFVLAMQVLLNVAGSHNYRVHIGRKFHTSSIKAFMDDTTLVMNRKQTVQRSLDKMNDLLEWCRMSFKPAKSRSLALTWRKIHSDVFLRVVGQRIPIVQEEPVKSLGSVWRNPQGQKSGNRYRRVWTQLVECSFLEDLKYGWFGLCSSQG